MAKVQTGPLTEEEDLEAIMLVITLLAATTLEIV
jgi:hypothetical protein